MKAIMGSSSLNDPNRPAITDHGGGTRVPFVTDASEIPYWITSIGPAEAAMVADTIARRSFSLGPVTNAFEAEIAAQLDVPYALCATSGSMSLVLALMALGIGPDDEVIVPTRTFIATAHAATILGAKPVFVDCLPDTPLIDPIAIKKKITRRTRVIIPVHLNGRAAAMEVILDLAKRHGIAVVEDAAQAIFSRHRSLGHLGTIGDAGMFSFSMVKLVATGQGGAVVSRRRDLYEKMRSTRNHGVADVVSHEYTGPGGNFKFNDVLASIGLCQIRDRDKKVAHVKEIYAAYCDGLSGFPFIRVVNVDVDAGEVPLWTEVVSDKRDAIMAYLAKHGIQTRRFVPCCHSAPHFSSNESFPNSERFSATGFVLPCGPAMPMDFVHKTIDALRNYRS